jgi:hypothetical protein
LALIKAGAKINEMNQRLQEGLWGKLTQEKGELLSQIRLQIVIFLQNLAKFPDSI